MAGTAALGWSHPMEYDPANQDLYIGPCDPFGQFVDVISTVTNTVIAQIRSGQDPFYAAFDPTNNDMYLDNANNNPHTVSVIDSSTNTIVATVLTPAPANPSYMAYDPANTDVYAANSGGGTVYVISSSSNTVVATFGLGDSARSLAYDPANKDMYAGTISLSVPHVVVIDSQTNTIIATIDVGGQSSQLVGLTFDPSNHYMYVSNQEVFYPGLANQNFVAVTSS